VLVSKYNPKFDGCLHVQQYKQLSELYLENFNAPVLTYNEFVDRINSDDVTIYTFEVGDKVVATASGYLYPSLLHGGQPRMQIENVCTRKEHQGNGYASHLIGLLIELAEEKGCYKVSLSCSDKNLDFYQNRGFKQHEHTMRIDLV